MTDLRQSTVDGRVNDIVVTGDGCWRVDDGRTKACRGKRTDRSSYSSASHISYRPYHVRNATKTVCLPNDCISTPQHIIYTVRQLFLSMVEFLKSEDLMIGQTTS